MREISLHILDIAQNSVAADASLIEITVAEDIPADTLAVTIRDNGKGMSEDMVKRVTDPFTTGRTTRKVGLGIPLIKMAAENTGGHFSISSEEGVGTVLCAVFVHSSIDRQPLGDMAGTVLGLVTSYEGIDFIYTHTVNGESFTMDTREIKNVLNGVSLSEPEVYEWLSGYLREGESDLEKTEV